MDADDGHPRAPPTPDELRRLAADAFAESNGVARGLLREHGDHCIGLHATGIGVRQIAVIRRPPKRRGASGLLVLQPSINDPSGQPIAISSSILLDGRAVPRLAVLLADFMDLELATLRADRPSAARAGGSPTTTPATVTHDDQHADPNTTNEGTQ